MGLVMTAVLLPSNGYETHKQAEFCLDPRGHGQNLGGGRDGQHGAEARTPSLARCFHVGFSHPHGEFATVWDRGRRLAPLSFCRWRDLLWAPRPQAVGGFWQAEVAELIQSLSADRQEPQEGSED